MAEVQATPVNQLPAGNIPSSNEQDNEIVNEILNEGHIQKDDLTIVVLDGK